MGKSSNLTPGISLSKLRPRNVAVTSPLSESKIWSFEEIQEIIGTEDDNRCVVTTNILHNVNGILNDNERKLLVPYARKIKDESSDPQRENTRMFKAVDWGVRVLAASIYEHTNKPGSAEMCRGAVKVTDPESAIKARDILYVPAHNKLPALGDIYWACNSSVEHISGTSEQDASGLIGRAAQNASAFLPRKKTIRLTLDLLETLTETQNV